MKSSTTNTNPPSFSVGFWANALVNFLFFTTPAKRAVRFKELKSDGFFPYLRSRLRCYERKVIQRTQPFTLEFIHLSKVDVGHVVPENEKLYERAEALKGHRTITIRKMSDLAPSDEPVSFLKHGDTYTVISGNGRTTACAMAGVEYLEGLVYEKI